MEKVELAGAEKPRKWASFDAAFVVLLIATAFAVAIIVMLVRQNASLKAGLARPEGTLAGPHSAQPGDLVPGFKATDIEGRLIEIVYDGSRRYLIYIFSPSCSTCVSEFPNWNRIAGEAVSQNYKVLGISIDSLEDSRRHLSGSKLLFNVSIMPNMPLQRAYRAISIPETLIVSSDGKIEWVHYGAMTQQTTDEMLAKIRSGQ